MFDSSTKFILTYGEGVCQYFAAKNLRSGCGLGFAITPEGDGGGCYEDDFVDYIHICTYAERIDAIQHAADECACAEDSEVILPLRIDRN